MALLTFKVMYRAYIPCVLQFCVTVDAHNHFSMNVAERNALKIFQREVHMCKNKKIEGFTMFGGLN